MDVTTPSIRPHADFGGSFDHYDATMSEQQWRETYERYRASCPVARINRYGGFYLVSS
ncbi:hypothetical protein [uncultured Mycobacterium sp.]|uniref:hypothetical protein n=1 Tax=uncultured Mycobacterium sp. TaxID=171292 RepID=UPI0035CBA4BA